MIKAVVFDLGGVLIDNPASSMRSYCARSLGVPEEEFANAANDFISAFQKGLLSEKDFWSKITGKLGVLHVFDVSIWKEAISRSYSPKEVMFSLVFDLKRKGFIVGLLSNTEIPVVEFLQDKDYSIFDIKIFSCLEKSRKPEKRIYQLLLAKLELQPYETVFIDDTKENVLAAQELGIIGLLFNNPKQIHNELEKNLVF